MPLGESDKSRLQTSIYTASRKAERERLPRDNFAALSVQDLVKLGNQIIAQPDVFHAYMLLAHPIPGSSAVYYDALFGPQHREGLSYLGDVLHQTEPQVVERGLDVGAGTGNSSLVLAPHVFVLDLVEPVPAMLAVAQTKVARVKEQREATGDSLVINSYTFSSAQLHELQAESYDVIISHGVNPYISQSELQQYYEQIKRLLKPGGRFYMYMGGEDNQSVYTGNHKAALAGFVVDAVVALGAVQSHGRQIVSEEGLYQGFDVKRLDRQGRESSPFANEYVLQLTKQAA